MEMTEFEQLSYLVENLTTNAKNGFDKPNLKKLKSMCKSSNECLEQSFRLLFTQLRKEHSEIRLASVALIDEFFQRSHLFRTMLLDSFADFLELAAGTNFDVPLPGPKSAADELVKATMKCVHNWHQKYGSAYKKLALGYNFLKGTKKMQLINANEVQTEIQRNAAEDRRRKKDEFNRKRLDKIISDIKSNMPEIVSCVAELEACFSLLVPNFNEIDGEITKEEEQSAIVNEPRSSGILSHDYNIVIDIPQHIFNFVQINRNEDNEVILENLRDREKILRNVHISKVKAWLVQLGVCGAPSELMKQIIDLKATIMKTFDKSRDLVVSQNTADELPSTSGLSSSLNSIGTESESSDDDFVEVPEKLILTSHSLPRSTKDIDQCVKIGHADASIKIQNSSDTHVWKPIRDDDDMDDPTSYLRALAVQRKRARTAENKFQKSGDKKRELRKLHPKKLKTGLTYGKSSCKPSSSITAPVVPFGADLLEWDEAKKKELKETLSMGMARELDIGHRFWSGDTASRGDEVSEAALTALTTRSIPFVGQFEPVKRSCRAPLPSGKLCPRMDRFKCPFHGPIIARDGSGCPTNPEDRRKLEKTMKPSREKNDWQDPELLEELKAITGVDLKMPARSEKKRKKKKKYENLTDVRNMKDTSRFRLQKKVLDPKSIKRVSETLDRIEAKRNFQKFGNNFNYALN